MIRIDMTDLLKGVEAFKQAAEQQVLEVTQKITLDVHANVVRGSPVDKGEFRSAWTVEVPQKPFDNGRVENTTPYGPALAQGHSDQAPDGWIDNAVEAAAKFGGK